MSGAQKLFRYLWRVNAVLILMVTGAIAFLAASLLISNLGLGWKSQRRRVADVAPRVVADDSTERLYLGAVTQVEGTDTLRGELLAPGQGKGFSSGGYGSETRNLLFIDGQTKATRWLLPDSRHVITRQEDITSGGDTSHSRRTLAMAVLVMPPTVDTESAGGVLLLLDPSGRQVRTVSEDVREMDHAGLNADGRIVLLFERHGKYVMATFDDTSLEKRSEDELSVPRLR